MYLAVVVDALVYECGVATMRKTCERARVHGSTGADVEVLDGGQRILEARLLDQSIQRPSSHKMASWLNRGGRRSSKLRLAAPRQLFFLPSA